MALLHGGRLGAIRLRGAELSEAITKAVIGAPILELSASEVSQLSLSLDDHRFEVLRSGLFQRRTKLTFDDLAFELAALDTGGGTESETLGLAFRSAGAQRMDRRQKDPDAKKNLSPTEYMALVAKRNGLAFVGEPSAKRRHVGRRKDDRSDWGVGDRLARELGYVLFEVLETLYFARPSWLMKRSAARVVKVSYPEAKTRDFWVPDEVPVCRRSEDAGPDEAVTIDLTLPYESRVRPGDVLELAGIPTFAGRYLFQSASWTLEHDSPISASASTPIDPEPEPPQPPGGSHGSSVAGGTVATGPASASGFAWPVSGSLTSDFGPRGEGDYHYGVDIGVANGTRVGAAKGGTVVVAANDPEGYGLWVEVDHGGGWRTRYGHLSRFGVKVGQRVERGQVLGWTGETGNSQGPHLHFETRSGGSPVDPLSVLP